MSPSLGQRSSTHDADIEPEISVGGPQGIYIGPRRTLARASPALTNRLFRLSSLTRQGQRWIVAYGGAVVLAFIVLGVMALLVGAALINGLALPSLFYLPVLAAGGVCWAAALTALALRRGSRRALNVTTEREILQLAARMQGPLSIQETSRSLGLSLADAEAALTAMARAGYLAMDVDLDTGNLHFAIPRSLPQHDPLPTDPRR